MLIFVSLSDDPLSGQFIGSDACRFVIEMGHTPVCPIFFYMPLIQYSHSEGKEFILAQGKNLMPVCDEMWVFGDRLGGLSGEEKKTAIKNGKKVKRISSLHMRSKSIPKEFI